MSVSKGRVRRFVDDALTVRLATISAKGTPLLIPLWFARDGDAIFIGTRRGSLHSRNIKASPRVVMLFGDRGGRPTRRILHVVGDARVCGYDAMSLTRKARLAWRYFLRPAALAHWATNLRKLQVRNRYYAERTDPSMVEITLGDAKFVTQPVSAGPTPSTAPP